MYKILKNGEHVTISWTSKKRWDALESDGSWYFEKYCDKIPMAFYVRMLGLEVTLSV